MGGDEPLEDNNNNNNNNGGVSIQPKARTVTFAAPSDGADAAAAAATATGLKQEMDVLASLRHPNLVMFLGVCCDPRTNVPTMILTELMTCSLYDVLETHKTILNLGEILDIASDVSIGLSYLHAHEPSIIHRDISSKNVLLRGNRAKIADLGQAKVFSKSSSSTSNSSSALTGMPGYVWVWWWVRGVGVH